MKNWKKLLGVFIIAVIGFTMTTCREDEDIWPTETVNDLSQLSGTWKGLNKDSYTNTINGERHNWSTTTDITLNFGSVENNTIEMNAVFESTLVITISSGKPAPTTGYYLIDVLFGLDKVKGTVKSENNENTYTTTVDYTYTLRDIKRLKWLVNNHYLFMPNKFLLPGDDCVCKNCIPDCGDMMLMPIDLEGNMGEVVTMCSMSDCSARGKFIIRTEKPLERQ